MSCEPLGIPSLMLTRRVLSDNGIRAAVSARLLRLSKYAQAMGQSEARKTLKKHHPELFTAPEK